MLGRGPISGTAISGSRQPFIPQVTGGGGGWILEAPTGRGKKERVREERERLGILPKAVEAVIEQVVVEQIEAPKRDLDRELRRALKRKDLAYQAYYAEVAHREVIAREREALADALEAMDEEDVGLIVGSTLSAERERIWAGIEAQSLELISRIVEATRKPDPIPPEPTVMEKLAVAMKGLQEVIAAMRSPKTVIRDSTGRIKEIQ